MNGSIEPILEGIVAARPTVHDAPLRFGNASARARMITIYDLAQERDALVLGTENRSEYYLGYFTRFGDAASDVEPIWDLYKTEVKLASEMMGQPEAVLIKHPTAGLWGGQTDEDELGFTYHDADLAIVCLEELGLDVAAAAARSGVDEAVVERVAARVAAVDWKRSNAFYRDVLGAEVVPRGPVVAYRFGDRQLNVHGPGFDAFPQPLQPVAPG